MGQIQEEKKKRETSAEKKAMISEDVALGDIASDKIFEDDPELAKELEEDRKIQARALEYKEKKLLRAKKRKKRLIIFLIVIVIGCGAGFFGYEYYQQKKAEENSEAIVAVSDDQELVYVSVSMIAGNNITVEVLEEATGQASANIKVEEIDSSVKADNGASMGEAEETIENTNDSSEASSNDNDTSADTDMKDRGDMSHGSDNQMPGDMNISEGTKEQSQMPEMTMASAETQASTSSYVETGETAKYQIPVGTVVITKLGTSATFSSISSGNVLALAVEKGTDIIDKVWIIE
ncbi:MAG: hypothetical protein K6A23_16055 [Butyrivibrio sp.]|nr:hypothetical protein [Butyrivibrio sp.]